MAQLSLGFNYCEAIYMNSPQPLTLQAINQFSAQAFSQALGAVYEHSPWIAERAFTRRPFVSSTDLALKLFAVVLEASHEEQLALLNAHPELAGKEAQAGSLTAESTNEQSLAGLGSLDAAAREELTQLNAKYRAQNGFPFIICARLNNTRSIFGSLHARLHNTPQQEFKNALSQVGEIARLRTADLLGG